MAGNNHDVNIIPIDPLDPIGGVFFTQTLRNVLEFAKTHYEGLPPEAISRDWGAQIMLGSPKIRLWAMVTPEGRVVGHALATLEHYDDGHIMVNGIQCRAESVVQDATARVIKEMDKWGREHGATTLQMTTDRSDLVWIKKHGFKVVRHTLARPIKEE